MKVYELRKYQEFEKDCEGTDVDPMWLWMRWKCQTDLYFLGTEVFGFSEARDYKTRRKRCDPKIHRRMAKQLESDDDALLLWPRNHCKTSWVKYRMVQIIIQNPYARTGLWSRTLGLAKSVLKGVKNLLMNPTLRDLFPEIILPKKQWEKDTATELTVYRPLEDGQAAPDTNQIDAWGLEGTVTGHHYDYHFYDDIINEKSVTTPDQLQKVETWWQHVQAIREVTATEKMIGTRYHERDIYNQVIQERYFPASAIETHRAIVNGKPLYKYFRLKDLAQLRKRMGEWAFSCQYMNEPVPAADRLFMPPYPQWNKLPEKRTYYMAVDPALAKKWSNQTGIAIGCVDRDNPKKLFYVEAYGVKKNPNELAEEIVKQIVKYQPRRVGIEFGLQEGLKYLLEIKLKEAMGEYRIPHPEILAISTGNLPKHMKIDRTIAAFTRAGQAEYHPGMSELFQQMDFYNPHSEANDDDILDAAGMLIQTVEHFQVYYEEEKEDKTWKGFDFFQLHKPKVENGWNKRFAN